MNMVILNSCKILKIKFRLRFHEFPKKKIFTLSETLAQIFIFIIKIHLKFTFTYQIII